MEELEKQFVERCFAVLVISACVLALILDLWRWWRGEH